jgi:hypothetical protein
LKLSIRVEQEGAEVAGMVDGSLSGNAVVDAPGGKSHPMKRLDLAPVARRERDVDARRDRASIRGDREVAHSAIWSSASS